MGSAGPPPPLRQQGRHRAKVSVAAALLLSPTTRRRRRIWCALTDGSFNAAATAAYVASLLDKTDRPLVVVWDGGSMHRGEPIRRARGRLRLERLPPYAPMLNPVESLRAWLKYGRLCNFAPRDVRQLGERVAAELLDIRDDQERLSGFCNASDLADMMTLLM